MIETDHSNRLNNLAFIYVEKFDRHIDHFHHDYYLLLLINDQIDEHHEYNNQVKLIENIFLQIEIKMIKDPHSSTR